MLYPVTIRSGLRNAIAAAVLIPASILLSGCGGDDDKDDRVTGQVTPTGVSGLNYQTRSRNGKTGDEGQFRYYPGETLQLSAGNLVLADGVPADRFVTPLDFYSNIRSQLNAAEINDLGLLSHRPVEQRLLESNETINVARLLLALNWSGSVTDGAKVDIRQRVVDQLNAALPDIDGTIDFSVSPADFARADLQNADTSPDPYSPANDLLLEICFFPEGDELCDEPPTLVEIENAPDRPGIEEEVDPDIDYKEDLRDLRDRILDGRRLLTNVTLDEVREWLTRELDLATADIANDFYLSAEIADIPASDTSLQTVRLRKVGASSVQPQALEAISSRPENVTIQSTTAIPPEVDYFISGPAGGESEILVNFQPENDYRWITKNLRVVIR